MNPGVTGQAGALGPGGASSVNSLTGLPSGQAGRSIPRTNPTEWLDPRAEGWRPLVKLPCQKNEEGYLYRCGKVIIKPWRAFRHYKYFWYKKGLVIGRFNPIDSWAICHAESGYPFVGNLRTFDEALILAESILPLQNWTRTLLHLDLSKTLLGQVEFRVRLMKSHNSLI